MGSIVTRCNSLASPCVGFGNDVVVAGGGLSSAVGDGAKVIMDDNAFGGVVQATDGMSY